MKEYRRGRKAYLTGKITEADSNILGSEKQSVELERQRNNVNWRLSAIPPSRNMAKPEEDPYRMERDRLNNDLRVLESQISQKLHEKNNWIKSKGEYQAELATLQD